MAVGVRGSGVLCVLRVLVAVVMRVFCVLVAVVMRVFCVLVAVIMRMLVRMWVIVRG
jgi:hypothetical protein